MTPCRFALALLLVAAPCAGPAPRAASAEHGDDAARARQAVREGRYVPLSSLLDWIEARYHGRAIEVELEEEEGEPPTYEIEWLTPQGRVVEFEFDARTGELLEREGRGLEDAAK